MGKILHLVGVQLWGMLGSMLAIGGKKGRKPKALYIGMAFFYILMAGISFFYFYMTGSGLRMFDSLDILPSLVMAITCVVVIMTTVFKVKGTIFGFRDYDMVMSLPVSTGGIVASRVILLYIINLSFVLMLMLPMIAAYGILARPGAQFYALGILSIIFIPMIPIILASVIGTIITYAAAKFRHSNAVGIVISFAVLLAFIIFSFTMGDSGEELVDMGRMLTDRVNSLYPLADLYSRAVCKADLMAFLLFAGISIISFFVYSAVIGLIFKKVNTDVSAGRYTSGYKMEELKTSTPLMALYKKELRRFFSSTLYVLNMGFGVVLLTIGAIALQFVDIDKLLAGLGPTVPLGALYNFVPMIITFCTVMACTTAASISLEGKSLWIVKSLPVTPETVLGSKLLVNLTILAPAIGASILISYALEQGFLAGLITLLVTASCAVFTSLMGLWANLKFPVFDWTTETVVIKQSAATMIAVFTGMGIVGLQFAFIAVFGNFIAAYSLYFCLLLIADICLYNNLMKKGAKRFLAL